MNSSTVRVREHTPERRCPYCHDAVLAGSIQVCSNCQAWHHTECWEEFGGCSTMGCSSPSVRKRKPEELTTLEELRLIADEYYEGLIYILSTPIRLMRRLYRRAKALWGPKEEVISYPIDEKSPDAPEPPGKISIWRILREWPRRFFLREMPPLDNLASNDPLRHPFYTKKYEQERETLPWPRKDPHLYPEDQINAPSPEDFPLWYRFHPTRFLFTLFGKKPEGVDIPYLYKWIILQRQIWLRNIRNILVVQVMLIGGLIAGIALTLLTLMSITPWWIIPIPFLISATALYLILNYL